MICSSNSNTFHHLSVDIYCLLLHTFLLLGMKSHLRMKPGYVHTVLSDYGSYGNPLFSLAFCDPAHAGEARGGRHHTSLLTRGGRSPSSLGPSLTSEGGVIISLGWRWEYRLTDKALGAASSLLGDGRRHNPLILLCWHDLIAAGWGSKSRREDKAHNQRGRKTRQLSAWSPLIPHCGAAEMLCSREDEF